MAPHYPVSGFARGRGSEHRGRCASLPPFDAAASKGGRAGSGLEAWGDWGIAGGFAEMRRFIRPRRGGFLEHSGNGINLVAICCLPSFDAAASKGGRQSCEGLRGRRGRSLGDLAGLLTRRFPAHSSLAARESRWKWWRQPEIPSGVCGLRPSPPLWIVRPRGRPENSPHEKSARARTTFERGDYESLPVRREQP